MTTGDVLLELNNVTKTFQAGTRSLVSAQATFDAVKQVSIAVSAGEILGLVGESGAGKTTVGRLAMGLENPTSGIVSFEGAPQADRTASDLRHMRQRMHLIFQDPYQSLHPGMKVGELVAEPLEIARMPKRDQIPAVIDALEKVKLNPATEFLHRFPHELSGGQRQRVAFARAFVAKPRCVIADEPTSMLDVSLRAGILELLSLIRDDTQCAVLYITHDLAMARHICDRIGVMKNGAIIEIGPTDSVIDSPQHPYTKQLLRAAHNLRHKPVCSR